MSDCHPKFRSGERHRRQRTSNTQFDLHLSHFTHSIPCLSLNLGQYTNMAPAALPQRGPTALTSFPPPSANAPTLNAPPSTLITRTQKWIEENQRLLILGAAVAVVGGAGYLLYNRPPPRSTGGRGGSGSGISGSEAGELGAGGKKKKSKKGKKGTGLKDGFLAGEGDEGPLLEEIPQSEQKKPVQEEVKKEVVPDDLEGESVDRCELVEQYLIHQGVPDAAGLSGMSESQRNALGATLKDRGNKLYSKKEYKRAVEW